MVEDNEARFKNRLKFESIWKHEWKHKTKDFKSNQSKSYFEDVLVLLIQSVEMKSQRKVNCVQITIKLKGLQAELSWKLTNT